MRALAVAARGSRRRFSLLVCIIGAMMAVGATPALAVPFPVVTIGAPASVAYTTAHLSGTVNPEGSGTVYQFQYSVEPEFLGWTPAGEARSAGEGSSAVEVEEDLVGLAPNTPYQVRLIAINAEGTQEAATEAPYPSFTTLEVSAPTVSIAAPTAVTGTGASFSGEINPGAPGGNPAAFDVEWHFECTPECPGLTGGTIPADAENHTVEVAASGLLPGVHYEVSLITSNAGGQTVAGPQSFTTLPVLPSFSEVSANVQTTEATLQAAINPGGGETSYHFEYGPTAAYGHSTPVATIPAGNSAVNVHADILDLAAGSTYHFRIVASNSAGPAEGSDRNFTTASPGSGVDSCPNAAIRAQQETTSLPECRAMELANPPGEDLGDVVRVLTASNDGEHVAYLSPILPNGALGGQFAYAAVASRTSSGWSNADANIPIPEGSLGSVSVFWEAFSEDLSQWATATTYRVDPNDTGMLDGQLAASIYSLTVGTGVASWVSNIAPQSVFVEELVRTIGGSRDLSRIVFYSRGNNGGGTVYMKDKDKPEPEVVSLLPNGKRVFASPAAEDLSVIIVRQHNRNVVSANGTRIMFNAEGGVLYLRDTVAATTVAVSASQRTGEVGVERGGNFIAATSDGNLVYFQSKDQLTDAAPEGGGIYRFDVETKELSLLFADANDGSVWAKAILSADGSHLYFTSSNALASGAQAGQPNIYVWNGGSPRLVLAGLAGLARVSANGTYAVIDSSASIGEAPNNGHRTLYEYDDATGEVACASCRADGSPSEGDAALQAGPFASIGGWQTSRNIADNGAVFFTSSDRLTPSDYTSAMDAYEYRAGTVSLLTAGQGDADSYMADNSDDGKNAFILTRRVYDPRDRDANEIDLYDARVDGGFAYRDEEAPAKCGGDACQRPPTPAPSSSAIGTNGPAGKGNAKASSLRVSKPSKALRGVGVTLSLAVSGGGKVTISGARLRSASKVVAGAGSYRLRVTLTAAARAALKRKHTLNVQAKVLFTASDGSQRSAVVKLLFKSASSKGSR